MTDAFRTDATDATATATTVESADGPVRTCVGCRQRCRSVELLRVAMVDGILLPDPRRRLPGRGVWVHRDIGCVTIATTRRAFGRSLRLAATLDATPVRQYFGIESDR